jgi:AraC family transcriptional activator of pobA
MHIISKIDDLFSALKSPVRSAKKDFIAFRHEDYDNKPHIYSMNCLRTLFYRISIHMCESLDFVINNGERLSSRLYTLSFISPFHLMSFEQKSELSGQSVQFSESFMHYAYECNQFHKDFPFFWTNKNVFFLAEEDAGLLIQLFEKIMYEYTYSSLFSDNIIRDYLHIFLLEAKRIIGAKSGVVDSSSDYALLQQFFSLINQSNPIIRSVEHAAGILCVTQAQLWLIVKKLTGQTPSAIINQRVILEAQSLLLNSDLTISEIGFHLNFREKSHFTRFFKNLTGFSPLAYSRQLDSKNR